MVHRHWRIQPPVLGGGVNLGRGPNLGYLQNWKLLWFNPLRFRWTQIHFRKKVFLGAFFGGGGKWHYVPPFLGFGGGHGRVAPLDPPVYTGSMNLLCHCDMIWLKWEWKSGREGVLLPMVVTAMWTRLTITTLCPPPFGAGEPALLRAPGGASAGPVDRPRGGEPDSSADARDRTGTSHPQQGDARLRPQQDTVSDRRRLWILRIESSWIV